MIREQKILPKGYIERDKVIFVIALGLFLLMGILNVTLMDIPDIFIKVFRYLAYFLCLFAIMQMIYKRQQIAFCILFGAVSFIIFLQCRDSIIIIYMLLCLASLGVDEKVFLKIAFWIQAPVTIGVIVLSQCGMVYDYVHKKLKTDGVRIRHFLGFDYTTTGTMLLFFAICTYILIRKGRLYLLEYAVCMAVTIFMYIYTDTNFVFYISMLVINLTFFGKYFIKRGNITYLMRGVIYLIPWLCAGISILLQFLYNSESEIWNKLNKLVRNRLMLGHNAIEKYGFSLFGRRIEWIGFSFGKMESKDYNYVDCSYLQVALQFGTIMLILVLCLYTWILVKAIRDRQYYIIYVIVPILVLSMTEPRLFDLMFNPLVLLAFTKRNRGEGLEWSTN